MATPALDSVDVSWEGRDTSATPPLLNAVDVSWSPVHDVVNHDVVNHDAYGFMSSRMHAPARVFAVDSASIRYATSWRSSVLGGDGTLETVEPIDPDATIHYATPIYTSSVVGEPSLNGQTAAGDSVRSAQWFKSSVVPAHDAATVSDADSVSSGHVGNPVSVSMNYADGLSSSIVWTPISVSVSTAISMAGATRFGRAALSRGDHC